MSILHMFPSRSCKLSDVPSERYVWENSLSTGRCNILDIILRCVATALRLMDHFNGRYDTTTKTRITRREKRAYRVELLNLNYRRLANKPATEMFVVLLEAQTPPWRARHGVTIDCDPSRTVWLPRLP